MREPRIGRILDVMHKTVPPGSRRKHVCKHVPSMKQSLTEGGWNCERALVLFRSRFYPLDKEQAILVRILQRYEAAAPSFIRRRPNLRASLLELFIVFVHIINAEKKANASTALEHRL